MNDFLVALALITIGLLGLYRYTVFVDRVVRDSKHCLIISKTRIVLGGILFVLSFDILLYGINLLL